MGNEHEQAIVSGAVCDLLKRGEYVVCAEDHQYLSAKVRDHDVLFTIFNSATGEAEDSWPVRLSHLRALLEIADLSK